MIIYDLICANEHRFEGWFTSPEGFSEQIEAKLIHCPQCDATTVRRIPSAVAIGSAAVADERNARSNGNGAQQSGSAMLPSGTQLIAAYRQVVQAIIEGSEDVGSEFASEARRIHYQEAPERPIRGQATPDERAELLDEGIAVLPLVLPREEGLN